MAEERRISSDRVSRSYKSSPLIGSTRRNCVSEKSSLSDSYESPKSYGTTRNPLQPQCKVKLIGHVLEKTDTLQGLAIKYGVTVQELRRANKLWANDNIHLLNILRIPVSLDSSYYNKQEESVNSESPTTGSGMSEDKIKDAIRVARRNKSQGTAFGQSIERSNELSSGNKNKASAVNFLEQLDARIKSSVEESEKLRTVSGPKVISEVEKKTMTSFDEEGNLFRPLSTDSSRSHGGHKLASGMIGRKGKSAQKDDDDQFFEL